MSKRTSRVIVVLSTVLLALLLSATVFAQGNGPANYRAHLSGGEEVPAVDTDAQGQAIFQFNNDGSALSYKLIVANIDDVVAAHIHCGEAGVNGPVGVTLFSGGPTSANGVLAQATVDSPDAGNACGWETLADVKSAIDSGGAYVNVHTLANPPGEIRGQVH